MITTLVIAVAAFVGGVVFSYLFLRANPNKKAIVDLKVNEAAKKI
jgi:hypothetical protein